MFPIQKSGWQPIIFILKKSCKVKKKGKREKRKKKKRKKALYV
jgi:hypothetical protein